MRNAFSSEIEKLAEVHPEIVLLSGDIGNRLFDRFKVKFPNRFYNCGVAEANMMGVAAGLALCGFRPVPYTIVPFLTTRCLEQIRLDVCYQNLPVVIVGVGGGFSYASLNATHHSCEEVGMLRILPNMTVICPGDPMEARLSLRAAVEHSGPVYIRLGKKGEPAVHASEFQFQIGKGVKIRSGSDVCLLNNGLLLPEVVKAADMLHSQGVSAGVYSFHTVKPLDETLLKEIFNSCSLVVTVEEHSRLGGFGGMVAEWLTDHFPNPTRLVRIGSPDEFFYSAGEQDYAREVYGLDAKGIAAKTLQSLKKEVKL